MKMALNYFNNLYGSASTYVAAVCMCVAQCIIFFRLILLANTGVFNGKNNGSATIRSQRVQMLILYLLARGDSTPLHGTLMQFINVHGSSDNFLLIWLTKGILSCYEVFGSIYRAHFSML